MDRTVLEKPLLRILWQDFPSGAAIRTYYDTIKEKLVWDGNLRGPGRKVTGSGSDMPKIPFTKVQWSVRRIPPAIEAVEQLIARSRATPAQALYYGVRFRAINPGPQGNKISLYFDGCSSVATVVDVWNRAAVLDQRVTYDRDSDLIDSYAPPVGTVKFSGGSDGPGQLTSQLPGAFVHSPMDAPYASGTYVPSFTVLGDKPNISRAISGGVGQGVLDSKSLKPYPVRLRIDRDLKPVLLEETEPRLVAMGHFEAELVEHTLEFILGTRLMTINSPQGSISYQKQVTISWSCFLPEFPVLRDAKRYKLQSEFYLPAKEGPQWTVHREWTNHASEQSPMNKQNVV